MKYFDNTRVEAYRSCPRLFFFRHVKGWVREGTAVALVNGSSWHDAMDVVWANAHDKTISDRDLVKLALQAFVDKWTAEGMVHPRNMTLEQQEAYAPRGPHIAAETLMNYVIQRRKFIQDGEVLAIERPFIVPLDADGLESEALYTGRLDKIFRHRLEGTLAIEHKTTTQFYKSSGFRDSFLDSFSPNSQVDGYSHAGRILYNDFRGVWIDAAAFNKTVHDQFKFLPIDRQFSMLDSWRAETKRWISRIAEDLDIYETQGLTEGTFPKNTSHCGNYGGCSYRDVCKFYNNPDSTSPPSGFKVEKWSPFNVLNLAQLGLIPEDSDDTTQSV